MRLRRLRRIALALPLAALALGLLLVINEAGFVRSQQAVQALERSYAARTALDHLLQSMLDAETGQRGYLLTQDERYLRPYEAALASMQSNLQALREVHFALPEQRKDLDALAQAVAHKRSEMELSVQLRRKDDNDAWRFVLSTDVGREDMEEIRVLTTRMAERSTRQIERSTQQIQDVLTWSRAGIALAAVLGLLASYLYFRSERALRAARERQQQALASERERLERLVGERTATLSELAHHLQQVREQEREHLARELHDELGALLTAAKLDVARLKPRIDLSLPDSAERLQHLGETLNSGIALKRRIIEDLRPSSLSNLGLTTSLEILTREFAERSGIALQTHLEAVQLSDSAQLTVFRLVQEALTNIHKHARAGKVLVSLTAQSGQARIQVRDDGCGFDADGAPASAYGLLGMRHRVEAEGGRLSIGSTPGEGTLVSATLPCAVPAGAA